MLDISKTHVGLSCQKTNSKLRNNIKTLSLYWNRKDEKWNLVSLDDLKKVGYDFKDVNFGQHVMLKEHYTTKELIKIIIKRQINKIKRVCQ